MRNIKKMLSTLLFCFSTAATALDVGVTSNAAIANPGIQSTKIKSDAENAIGQLTYHDLWRASRTLVTCGTVRIDMQGVTGDGKRNIQVQINGVRGSSTVSAALVDPELSTTAIESEQRYIIRKVRHALNESLNSGNIYEVSIT